MQDSMTMASAHFSFGGLETTPAASSMAPSVLCDPSTSPAVSLSCRGKLKLQTLGLLWRHTTVALLKASDSLRAMGVPDLTLVVDRAGLLGGRIVIPLANTKEHYVRLLSPLSRRDVKKHTITIEYGLESRNLRLRASNDDEYRFWSSTIAEAIVRNAAVSTDKECDNHIASSRLSIDTIASTCTSSSTSTSDVMAAQRDSIASYDSAEDDVLSTSEIPVSGYTTMKGAAFSSEIDGCAYARRCNDGYDYDETEEEEEHMDDSAATARCVMMHAMRCFPLEYEDRYTTSFNMAECIEAQIQSTRDSITASSLWATTRLPVPLLQSLIVMSDSASSLPSKLKACQFMARHT